MTSKTAVDVAPAANSKQAKKPTGSVSFASLLRYATCFDWCLYLIGTIAAVINGLTMPAFSLLFGELLDGFNQGADVQMFPIVRRLSIIIILVGVGTWIFHYIELACFTIAGERQIRVIREKYFTSVLNQDISWFDKSNTNEIVTKVSEHTRAVREGIGEKFGMGIRFTTMFLGGFVLGFVQNWQLSLLLLAMAPLMAGSAGSIMMIMTKLEKAAQSIYAAAGAIAQEQLAAIRTVQAFGGQKKAVAAYSTHLDSAYQAGAKKGFVQGASMGSIWVIMFVMYGVAFWFGAHLIANNREDVATALGDAGCDVSSNDFSVICSPSWEVGVAACRDLCTSLVVPCLNGDTCHSGGNIVMVFFAVIIGAMGIGQAGPSFTAATTAKVAGHDILKTIDTPIVINARSTEGTKQWVHTGGITLSGVTFSYPTRPDNQVLQGTDIRIQPGTTVALVGHSGCGKSTVMSLIQRFYDADSGVITVDGIPIQQLNVRNLRSMMGYVGQEPALFATSIRQNIMYGLSEGTVSQSDVETAARQANAHDFIMSFPDGYDTLVGEGGTALSGGQKQRVAIARALIRRPKILLLDEATSALDSTSEHVVQQALDSLMASSSHTTLVIAHRLSTIQSADQIVVMDAGIVAEVGRHDELMSIDGGIYRDLVDAQSSGRDGALQSLHERKDEVDEPERARSDSLLPSTERPTTKPESTAELAVKQAEAAGVDMSVWRILKMNSNNWPWFIVGLISAIVNGAVFPLFSVVFSEMVALFYEPSIARLRDDGLFFALLFGLLAVGAGAGQLGMFGSFGVMGESLARKLRRSAFDAMLHHEMSFHDKDDNNTGALATQLATDATLVNAMAGERLALMCMNTVTVITGLVLAFGGDWRLTLVVLCVGPIIGVGGYLQMKLFTGQSTATLASLEEAGHVVQESVHAARTVAAFGLNDKLSALYSEKLLKPYKTGIKGAHLTAMAMGFSEFAMLSTFGVAFLVGGIWVDDGSLTFEDMMLVLMAVMMTANSVGQSGSMAPDAGKAKVAMSHIFTLLDKRPSINCQPDNGGKTISSLTGALKFQDVSFEYPTREGKVLEHFNLDVPAGSTVALVGTSGSGKSTLVQLLQNFYAPQAGHIHIDGVDMRQLDTHWLRQNIGIVSQEPTLFSGTILSNIAYGAKPDQDISQHRIIEAAQAANAHEFITALGGYDTVIKPDALSGGQKQRIAIARAILRNPKILLLDEATSALDNRSEQVVQAALDNISKGSKGSERTTVVIAHRLSTIMDADNIVVMENGRIIEQGSHDVLTQTPGSKYKSMWEQQELVANASQ